ncbi:MAG: hypothetical protein OXT09_35235 [Myxococcales bacterium]|nr:hypothetical protein [Myxococcales bacterium]
MRRSKGRSGAEDLTDGLRALAPGLYLGVATTRAGDGTRSRPTVFLLSGPVGDFVGPDRPDREVAIPRE